MCGKVEKELRARGGGGKGAMIVGEQNRKEARRERGVEVPN